MADTASAAASLIDTFKGTDGHNQGRREALRNISDLLMGRITSDQFDAILEHQRAPVERKKDHAAFSAAYIDFVEDFLNSQS